MKSLPWLRVVCSLLGGGLALFVLWHIPWSQPRAVIPNCLDSEFEFTPDSRKLLVWSGPRVPISSTLHGNEPGIHVHDATTGQRRAKLEASEEDFASALEFSPDGRLVMNWVPLLGPVRVWEIATGRLTVTRPGSELAGNEHGFFSPDGEVLIAADSGFNWGTTRDLKDRERMAYKSLILFDDGIATVVARRGPLGAYPIGSEVRVIDYAAGKKLHVFPFPPLQATEGIDGYRLWAGGKMMTALVGALHFGPGDPGLSDPQLLI